MRLISLADALKVQTKPCCLHLPSNVTVDLTAQSCLFLAHHRSDLTTLYETLRTEDTVVISCLPNASYLQGHNVVLEPESMSTLLRELRNMIEGRLCGQLVVNTVVVDNISVFTWEIELLTAENYSKYGYDKPFTRPRVYGELNRLLDDLKQMYKCNVIVTSYDAQFDKGYDCESLHYLRNAFEEFLSLPVPYLIGNDVIIYANNGVIYEVDKGSGRMAIRNSMQERPQVS